MGRGWWVLAVLLCATAARAQDHGRWAMVTLDDPGEADARFGYLFPSDANDFSVIFGKCEKGAGKVQLLVDLEDGAVPGSRARVEVRSSQGQAKLEGPVEQDEKTYLVTEVPFDHPVFAALSGKAPRLSGPNGQDWPLEHEAGTLAPVVRDFIAACRALR